MGRRPRRRVHHRPSLAARRRGQPAPPRGHPARRPRVDAQPPPPPAPAPPPGPALVGGGYEPVEADGDVLAYLRTGPGGRYLVALNLGPHPARLAPPGLDLAGRVAAATDPARQDRPVAGELSLAGDEGVVVALA
jgi:Domain of unknown function (DUF3459)